MSQGGLIPHIDGVKDEYVDAAFIGGTVYLLWQLMKRAASPSTTPPASGPPATVLPPPPGGHIDPTAPPASGGGWSDSIVYHVPAPVAQRDYYGSGPAIAPPQAPPLQYVPGPSTNPGVGHPILPYPPNYVGPSFHQSPYVPPSPAQIAAAKQQLGPTHGHSSPVPKSHGGHVPAPALTTDQMAADQKRHGVTKGRHY